MADQPMSPATFAQSMRRTQDTRDASKADKHTIGIALMVKALASNGFADGLEVFMTMTEGM